MSQFLLVHGAWHGAWCWGRTIEELKKRGHQAQAVDLPGHGDDPTPLAQVTLDAYADRIVDALKTFSQPVVLAGHSMGGMAVSAAAEKASDRIKSLVYVCAFLPRDGESLASLEHRNPRPSVPTNLVKSADGISGTIPRDKCRMLFYHDCAETDVAMALFRLRPQALAPLITPVHLTPERFGRVPRVYVECTDDQAIAIELQRDMIAASPGTKVRSLKASHSPFLSMPDKLAEAMGDL